MGDYLDVGGRSAQGEMLRNAAGLGRKSDSQIRHVLDLADASHTHSGGIGLLQFPDGNLGFEVWTNQQVEPSIFGCREYPLCVSPLHSELIRDVPYTE